MVLIPLAQPVDTALVIAGFALPSASPLFLGTLALHVLAGLIAVLAGLVAILARKGPGRHPASGTIFYRALLVVFGTNLLLAGIRLPHNNIHLIILGALALAAAHVCRRARQRALPGWRRTHIPCM